MLIPLNFEQSPSFDSVLPHHDARIRLQALFLNALVDSFRSVVRNASSHDFVQYLIQYFDGIDFSHWFELKQQKGFSSHEIWSYYHKNLLVIFDEISQMRGKAPEDFWIEICSNYLLRKISSDIRSSFTELKNMA